MPSNINKSNDISTRIGTHRVGKPGSIQHNNRLRKLEHTTTIETEEAASNKSAARNQ